MWAARGYESPIAILNPGQLLNLATPAVLRARTLPEPGRPKPRVCNPY